MSGSQTRTTDGVIGTSGAKIRIYGFILRANSGGASSVNIYDGTSSGGVLRDVIDVANASSTTRVMYASGLYLGAGCFVDVDANTSFITAIYKQEND